MKKLKTIGIALITLTVFSCSNSDDTTITNNMNIETLLEEINFNGYAIITKNGTDVVRKGYGLANTGTGLAQAATLQYRLGSVSKTLTAAGIVQLKRDGLITGFNQTIADFDPEFPNGNQITLAQLLSHQSGIPDYLSYVEDDAFNGTEFTATTLYEVIETIVAQEGLLFTPGMQKQYSNSNYVLLALLIQEVSGTDYYQYITQNVLTPLGMTSTEKGANAINTSVHAEGYNHSTPASDYPIEITFGAGDWSSTPNDMELWADAAKNAWFTTEEKALIFATNVEDGYTDYGLGWFTSQESDTTLYWHGGDINGYWSMIGFMPKYNSTIVLLSNNQGDAYSSQRNTILEALMTSF
ncbi:serine hydrolase [Neptunitalea chrysea]|uniref:Serine hydrolase n=1 Tax=Neptunitalea chrysea TaxID=1647581 RepID=A0A9W6B4B7_9FLAO|nr:serine hydrolase domain-containing protein [Neptunitalea chrysea]GLB52486.1 serine hydrolase [Neptunitalea chrysea]